MEIIVWDNASGPETRKVLNELVGKQYIDKCFFSDRNLLFAGGNNACAKLASAESRYYLLLNSDIRIVSPEWFSNLMKKKVSGNYAVAAYGACYNPDRADGYCYLIDKEIYDSYPLDENFQWFWSITKQQARIREMGKSIFAYLNHDKMLIHWGGASGKAFVNAKGMDIEMEKVLSWFDSSSGRIVIKHYSFCDRIKQLINKILRLPIRALRKIIRILRQNK